MRDPVARSRTPSEKPKKCGIYDKSKALCAGMYAAVVEGMKLCLIKLGLCESVKLGLVTAMKL